MLLQDACDRPWCNGVPKFLEFSADLVVFSFEILSGESDDEALKLWEGIDRTALFEKSRAMTGLFIEAVETLCAGHGLTLASPREAAARGSHVAFLKDEGGYEIVQALIARGITGDYREPGLMRFGFAPLYLRYRDAVTAARQMADIVTTRAWDDDRFRQRGAVT